LQIREFDYELPPDRIAGQPADPRDSARLLLLSTGLADHSISDLPDLLEPGDLLVVNDTKVVPARVFGRRATGGKVEFLLLRHDRALVKAHRRLRPGEVVEMDGGMRAELLEKEGAVWRIRIESEEPVEEVLQRVGHVPLPPYIKRPDTGADRASYQTMFAAHAGSAAAPTAGLHFTPGLVTRLEERGIGFARVTLHVGYGTFQPIEVDDVESHRMHREEFEVTAEAAEAMNSRKGRLVAVGTTTTRVLETLARTGGIRAERGATDLFLYPGQEFRAIDGLLTNFHLPQSSLLMLVCAFAGTEKTLAAYKHAVELGYRFFSYGDAMLVLPAR
jgi:S-adenosylmethionine:tRNA ribosyltransferase-isomerase